MEEIKKNSDQVMLITGCASGIGQHLTTVLAGQGYNILATDVNLDALEKSADESKWDRQRVLLKKLDVRKAADWQEAMSLIIKQWGKIDVCMNIAGFCIQGFLSEFPLEHIDLHIDINTKGAMLGTKFAAEQMLKQGHGHIVNMCSLAGLAAVPGTSLYSASKFALRGFTLAVYFELKPHGISVTLVEPDLVDTAKLQTQLIYGDKAAAIGFSAPRILTVEDIEKVILKKVLKKKVLEVAIPTYRGWLCKFGGNFPKLSGKLYSSMAVSGMKSLEKEKSKREGFEKVVTPDRWIMEKEVAESRKKKTTQ
jgi:3-oxoacyl-[acyl-carrier protein] reductase